jgi:large subunit ribosomal protein L3
MCKGIIGKKLGMTNLFAADGRFVPVTVVQAGPCVVTQVKTEEKDGYNALQIGFGEKKAVRINRPMKGHLKASGGAFAFLREVAVEDPSQYSPGQTIALDMFAVGEKVDVTGTSKGRGFQGVVKRHGFHLGRKTHGSHSYREPGSIGCSAWPAKVIKGKKMPGRYGNDRTIVRNLEIIDIRPEENLVMIKGALPGTRSGLVAINKALFIK